MASRATKYSWSKPGDKNDYRDGYLQRMISRGRIDPDEIMKKFKSAVGSFATRGRELYDEYNSRIENTGYRSDSGIWGRSVSDREAEFKNLYKQISDYAEMYAPILGDQSELLKEMQAQLNNTADIRKYADSENKYWSQWEDEDAYNTWNRENQALLKKQEGYRKYDAKAGQAKIDELKADIEKYKSLRREYGTDGGLSPMEEAELRTLYFDLSKKWGSGSYSASPTAGTASSAKEARQDFWNDKKSVSGYVESTQDLDALLDEKKRYHSEATEWQEAERMSSVANPESEHYDPKFEIYTSYDDSKRNSVPLSKATGGEYYNRMALVYHYINSRNEKEKQDFLDAIIAANGGNTIQATDMANFLALADHMTEDEKKIFNYYYNSPAPRYELHNDTTRTERYFSSIRKNLENETARHFKELGHEHPVVGSVLSVGTNLYSGLETVQNVAEHMLTGEDLEKSHASLVTSSLREGVGQDMSGVGRFFYNTAMSGVDSLVSGIAFGNAGGVALALAAGSSAINDGLDRGMTDGQAIANGLASALFEGVFESISLGQFDALKQVKPKTWKDIALNVAKTIGVNASEEMATEIANITYDTIANGRLSDYQNMLDEGKTPLEALGQFGLRVLESGASGALMGLGFGGGNITVSKVADTWNAGRIGRDIKKEGKASTYIEKGLSLEGTKASEIASKIDATKQKSGKVSSVKLGRLAQNMSASQMSAAFQSELGEDSRELSDTLTDIIKGEEVSDKRYASVMKSDKALSLLNEALGTDVKAENSSREARESVNKALEATVPKDVPAGKISRDRVVKSLSVNLETREAESFADTIVAIANGDVVSDKKVSDVLQNRFARNALNKYLERSVENKFTAESTVNDVRAAMVEGDFSRKGQAVMYGATFGMKENGIKGLVSVATATKGDVSQISQAYNAVYQAGKQGKAITEAKNPYLNTLTPIQRNMAYEYGVMDSMLKDAEVADTTLLDEGKIAEEQKKIDNAEKSQSRKEGKVIYDGDRTKLSSLQKRSLHALETVSEALGVTFHMYESQEVDGKRVAEVDGKKTSANGWYDSKTGEIWIDMNAGVNGDGLIIWTASHELTHFIKQWSPKKFKVFADFLLENYAERGISKDALIDRQIAKAKRNGREISRDEALEEVIADSCETFLLDSNAAEKIIELRNKDKSLAQKILDFLKKALRDVKAMLKGVQPDSLEGKLVSEMAGTLQQLHDLWADALADASEAYSTAKTVAETREDGKKLSERDEKYTPKNDVDNYTKEQYNDVYNKSVNQTGGKNARQESTDSILLGRGEISTSNRSEDNVWEYSKNTRTLQGLMGISDAELRKGNFKAGQSEWLEGYQGERGFVDTTEVQRLRGFLQSFRRKLSETKLKNVDTVGRKLSSYVLDNFSKTAFKTEDGKILSLWHWTNQIFSKFEYGDIGFHAGIFDAAHAIMFDKDVKGNTSIFKELYFNSENPLFIERDLGTAWTPHLVASLSNVLNANEEAEIYSLDGSTRQQYDSPASIRLREMLRNKGYDSIIYINAWEGGLSVIAFDSDQFYTVAENGVETNFEADDNKYSDRDPDALTNREILANMLDSVAESERDKAFLDKYKARLAQIDEDKAEIFRLKEEKKGAEKLRREVIASKIEKLENGITESEKWLKNLEETATLKRLVSKEREAMYAEAVLAGQMAQGKSDAKVIRKQQEKLDKEKQKRADMRSDMQQKARESKAEAVAREKQKRADMLAEYRERVAEREQRIKEKYQESREKAIEGRNKTEIRNKIKGVVSKLHKLLTSDSKEKHVPSGLKTVVADALSMINMDTVNAEERIRIYNERIAKATDPIVKESLIHTRDEIEAQGVRFAEKIAKLQDAYAQIKKDASADVRSVYSEDIEEYIKAVREQVGDTSIKDMDIDQLEAVYEMFKIILKNVRDGNNLFLEGLKKTVSENSMAVDLELAQVGKSNKLVSKNGKLLKKFSLSLLKPVTFMKMLGSKTFTKLYENIRKGEDTWAVDVNEAKDFFSEMRNKYKFDSWDLEKKYDFVDEIGNKFSLTVEQIMSLYAYSKRDKADLHLEKGGFVYDSNITVKKKNKLGIPTEYYVNDTNPYRLGKELVKSISSNLSKDMTDFVDEMQAYLSDVMGEKGNEVSMTMYDVRLFKEKNYFPLKTSKYFREFDPEKGGTPKIKNSGFTHKTLPGASNPIVLSNFMDVWANHVNDMAMYHAFTLPVEDFMRVYNYNSRADGFNAIKQKISKYYGDEANKYIQTLIDQLNGGARSDPDAGVVSKGIAAFKKAKTFVSASVVIQQPSALARAWAYIDPKYFVDKPQATSHDNTWAELKKYAPVAIIKEMGRFDANMGRSTADYIMKRSYDTIKDKAKGVFTDKEYRDDVLSKAPALADELAWCAIWKAVKREVAAKTNIEVNSSEYFERCGERFTEIIENTQVYDSVLSKSEIMRSKDSGLKMVTAFASEPLTTVNMMVDAIVEGNRGRKAFAWRSLGSVMSSVVLNSILVSIVYAARDDDEDETYSEKYLASLTSELVDGFNPLTYIPIVRDAWSVMQGYDIERTDMSMIGDVWQSVEGLFSTKKSGFDKVSDLVGNIAAIFGVPADNVMRDARAIYNVGDLIYNKVENDLSTTKWGVRDAVAESVKNVVPLWSKIETVTGNKRTKYDELYEAMMSGDETYIKRAKSHFDTEEKLESGIKRGLKDNDVRIEEAARAYISGDVRRFGEIIDTIASEGVFDAETVESVVRSVINEMKPNVEAEKTIEVATSIYKAADINLAFENGDTEKALEILSELIEVKTINNEEKLRKKAEEDGKAVSSLEILANAEFDARSSIKSSITSYWKPLYISASKDGNKKEMERIYNILLKTELYGEWYKLEKTLREWLE